MDLRPITILGPRHSFAELLPGYELADLTFRVYDELAALSFSRRRPKGRGLSGRAFDKEFALLICRDRDNLLFGLAAFRRPRLVWSFWLAHWSIQPIQ